MKKEFTENESFLHKHAKDLLSDELIKTEIKMQDFCEYNVLRWRKNYGVFKELPFYESSDPYYFESSEGLKDNDYERHMSNCLDWFDPEFDRGKILFIPDITIFHKGEPKILIEIVHKNKTPQWKINKINKFFSYVELYEVSAYQIMAQIKSCDKIKFNKIL